MAESISNYLKNAYTDLVMARAEQAGSVARPYCAVKTGVPGVSAAFGYLGNIALVPKASRHAPTPNNDLVHQMRWADLAAYHGNILLDETDQMAAFSDPKSDYVRIGGDAIGVKYDQIILAAAIADAKYGVAGGSTEDWSAYTDREANSHVIAVGTGPLTLDKVRQAKRIFLECEVKNDLVLFVSPQGLEDMLAVTEAISADYNSVKALVRGDLNTFLGFEWVVSNQLPIASTTRSCIAMQRGAVGLAIGIDRKVRVSERDDLSYAWQAYFEISAGAVRRDPERVIEIQITES